MEEMDSESAKEELKRESKGSNKPNLRSKG